MSSAYDPGGSAWKRSRPVSGVVNVTGPPINAGELTRTTAPTRTPPWVSLTDHDEGSRSAPERQRPEAPEGARQRPATRSLVGIEWPIASVFACPSSLPYGSLYQKREGATKD